MSQLWEWAAGHGMEQCALEVHCFSTTGRGLMATEDFEPGDVIISIPRQLLITPELASRTLQNRWENFYKESTTKQQKCIFLINEQLKSRASTWWPYLKSLPQAYDSPSYWSKKELKALPEWIRDLAGKSIKNLRSDFVAALQSCDPDLRKFVTWKKFRWAWCTVNTRAVYWPKDEAGVLAPVLDLLNHSAAAEITSGYNEVKQKYEIVTLQKYKKGEQVFINYGPHDNIKLLIEYGFVLPHNPHNTVQFDKGDVTDLVHFYTATSEQKLQFILEAQLMQQLHLSLDDISWNLEVIIAILAEPESNKSKWHQLYIGEEAIKSTQEFNRVLKALVTLKQQKVPEDYKKLKKTSRQPHIVQICEEQLEILQKWSEKLS